MINIMKSIKNHIFNNIWRERERERERTKMGGMTKSIILIGIEWKRGRANL